MLAEYYIGVFMKVIFLLLASTLAFSTTYNVKTQVYSSDMSCDELQEPLDQYRIHTIDDFVRLTDLGIYEQIEYSVKNDDSAAAVYKIKSPGKRTFSKRELHLVNRILNAARVNRESLEPIPVYQNLARVNQQLDFFQQFESPAFQIITFPKCDTWSFVIYELEFEQLHTSFLNYGMSLSFGIR